MRFSALLLLLAWINLASAQWTGVEVSLANTDSDWDFGGETRKSQLNFLSLQIEEKTEGDLRIGARLGQMSARVVGNTAAETLKFDPQFIGVYLRLPAALTDSIELHGQLNLSYYTGRDSDDDNPVDIDWNEIELQLGASWRIGRVRIMPFVTYSDVDGDVSDNSGTRVFELEDPLSGGVGLDYFTDRTAFVRLEIYTGNRSGGYLTFARRY